MKGADFKGNQAQIIFQTTYVALQTNSPQSYVSLEFIWASGVKNSQCHQGFRNIFEYLVSYCFCDMEQEIFGTFIFPRKLSSTHQIVTKNLPKLLQFLTTHLV